MELGVHISHCNDEVQSQNKASLNTNLTNSQK